MTPSRRAALLFLAALAAVLTACTGLPTTGSVNAGLSLSDAEVGPPEITQLAAGPIEGAGPEEIVQGFLDAAITSADGWEIARRFLSPELAQTWRPTAGVTLDASGTTRTFTSDVAEATESAESGEVRVQLQQVASVDAAGIYTQLSGGSATASFELARTAGGQWRITAAADGIVLDEESFLQVFRRHALQFYDRGWAHLVPDVRWYPRRTSIATTLTQALLANQPVDWLAPAVRSAFPGDVGLAREAVPVTSAQVAEVELNSAALGLDTTTLARMRTQLEKTLTDAGVSEVRFSVNGRDLEAGRAGVDALPVESGPLVLTAGAFGYVVGDELTALPVVSDEIVGLGPAVTAIDLAADDERAAVQLNTGAVYTVSDGRVDELDAGPGLIPPAMDLYGYTWTVPASAPGSLTAWRSDVTSFPVANALGEAAGVSQVRVSPDGARLAAVIAVGGQRRVAVAAVIRDENAVPVELGVLHMLAPLPGASSGLVWLGEDTLGVLVDDGDRRILITQLVGGPALLSPAPAGAVSVAGARTANGVRVLDGSGIVFAKRGTTWQESITGVLVLATHAGQ